MNSMNTMHSHLTPHTTHLTPHTSHDPPHTSHLTPPASHLTTPASQERTPASQEETPASQEEIPASQEQTLASQEEIPASQEKFQLARRRLQPETPAMERPGKAQRGQTPRQTPEANSCNMSMATGGYADTTFSHEFRMPTIAYAFLGATHPHILIV